MALPLLVGRMLASRTLWAIGGTIVGSVATAAFGVDIAKDIKEGCAGILEDIERDLTKRSKNAAKNKALVDDIRKGKQ